MKDVERVLAEKERNFSFVEARALVAEQRVESFENQLRLSERARMNDTSLENEIIRLRGIIDEKRVTTSELELKNQEVEAHLHELEDNFSKRIADYEGMVERQQHGKCILNCKRKKYLFKLFIPSFIQRAKKRSRL